MRPAARRAGVVAGVAGLVAAGTAVGLAAERYAIGRIRHAPDPAAGEPFGRLRPARSRTVTTSDGVPLAVEEVGPASAPLTVVFVHGFALAMGCWHFQRLGLADMRNPKIRMVFYDQRSHGRSGSGPAEAATIDQLGRDLHAVLTAVARTGPVVLIGHSMGGMTVMALADAHPELFGSRVVGVALLSTSTGRLAEVTLGLPAALARLRSPVLPLLLRGVRSRAALVERSRRIGSDLAWLVIRRYGFATKEVSPALVEYVGQLIAATPVDVLADYYGALHSHDKLAALGVLAAVETLILVGAGDLMTPPAHSRVMAEALPSAELVVVDEAGHLAMLERPTMVNLRLRAFLHRAVRSAGRPSSRRKA